MQELKKFFLLDLNPKPLDYESANITVKHDTRVLATGRLCNTLNSR